MQPSLAHELMDILLEEDAVDFELQDKNARSALSALRKLSLDFEIIEWRNSVLPNLLRKLIGDMPFGIHF